MRRFFVICGAIGAAACVVLQACGDDDVVTTKADAGSPNPPVDSGGAPDAPPGDAGRDSGGNTFTVPAGGGSFDFAGQSMKITFVFPASAAGKTITFALGTATDTGFPSATFSDVIKLAPNGERFSDPILVKPEKKELVGAVLTFAESPAKTPASAAEYSKTAGGYEVRHFTALVIAPPGKVCDSEGFSDTPASGRCSAAGAATTFRALTCKGYSYCVVSTGSCCVDPAVDSGTGCTVANQIYNIGFNPSDSNGGQYPYCDGDAGDWDGGDAGCAGPMGLSWSTDGGCAGQNTCALDYNMGCNGTTCTCTRGGNTVTGTFAQGTACDNSATIRTAYVQKCNYPPR